MKYNQRFIPVSSLFVLENFKRSQFHAEILQKKTCFSLKISTRLNLVEPGSSFFSTWLKIFRVSGWSSNQVGFFSPILVELGFQPGSTRLNLVQTQPGAPPGFGRVFYFSHFKKRLKFGATLSSPSSKTTCNLHDFIN